MSDVRSRLADLPGIQDLPAVTLDELALAGREVKIPSGWTPIHQQEPADKAYVILEGSLTVLQGGDVVASIEPGSFAGEMGFVDHRLRNAQLTAISPVQVLAWPAADFEQLRERHPEFDGLVRASAQARHEENDSRT